MSRFGHLQRALGIALLLAAAHAAAIEPCAPFEGGVVDERLLEVMRNAARNGRLYRVLPENSRVGFCVRHFPGKEYRGEFTDLVGGLTLPPAMDQYGQALLLIYTREMISTNPELDELVLGQDFMDTGRFPEILFIGRAFQWYTPLQGYIYGDLTLHGKTRPVVFEIQVSVLESTPEGRLQRIHLLGHGQVDRKEFNITSHRLMVSESVRLCLSVDLELTD